jgi:hypothetical protein
MPSMGRSLVDDYLARTPGSAALFERALATPTLVADVDELAAAVLLRLCAMQAVPAGRGDLADLRRWLVAPSLEPSRRSRDD